MFERVFSPARRPKATRTTRREPAPMPRMRWYR